MESFKFLFTEACDNLKISAYEKLLSRIDDAANSSLLNLSGTQFSDDICKALGQALMKDIHIRELDCSNCLLSDEGLTHILWGLENNRFLVSLKIKGNNVRSSGAQALGKFFRHNNHLQNLYLEWNGLGIFPEKFAIFCEGLCSNHSLKSLDLRNNQLNRLCAQWIADAIFRNSTLQKLDLRWNSIGLIGGRSILKALSRNQTILSIDLSGNDIPSELLESIQLATSATALRYINNNEQIARSKFLANKLQEKEEERTIQVKSLMEQLERRDKDASMNERWSSKKLVEAEEALAEKDKVLENFTLKTQEMESELWSKSEEIKNLALSINVLETKNRELVTEHKLILSKEQKEREKIERELYENLGSSKEENLFLKQQIQDLLTSKAHNEEEVLKLKSKVSKLEDLSKKDKSLHEEQIINLKELYAETERENAALYQSQISQVKEEFAELEKILKHKISFLESRKSDLEEELKEKNTLILSLRAQSEEKLIDLEKKLKSDHDLIKQQLEERIDLLEESNKEQNDHLQSDLQLLHQLKTDITSMDLDLAEQSHEIQHLKQCLEEKDAEMKAHETKIRLEVKQQLEELPKANKTIQELRDQNEDLKNIITELKVKHKKELNADIKIIQNFKDEIKKYERKIKEMSEEEFHRTFKLQEAFKVYFKGGKHDKGDDTLHSGDSPARSNE